MDAATALGTIATVVFLVRLLPQPLRLVRTGVPDGVSPMSIMNMALSELAWLVYGITTGLVPVWAVSLPALPLGLWTAFLLRRQFTRRDVVGSGLWLFAILVACVLGPGALGSLLGVSVVVNYGPQVLTALRGHHLEGLAPATWFLALADAATWGAYGLAVGDPALMGYCSVLLISATTILVRIAQTNRENDLVVTPVTVAPAELPVALATAGDAA